MPILAVSSADRQPCSITICPTVHVARADVKPARRDIVCSNAAIL